MHLDDVRVEGCFLEGLEDVGLLDEHVAVDGLSVGFNGDRDLFRDFCAFVHYPECSRTQLLRRTNVILRYLFAFVHLEYK